MTIERRPIEIFFRESSDPKPSPSANWVPERSLLVTDGSDVVEQVVDGAWISFPNKAHVDSLDVDAGTLDSLSKTDFGRLAVANEWDEANTFDSIGVGAAPSFDIHIQQPAALAALVIGSGLSSASAVLRLDNDLSDFAFLQIHGSTSTLSRWGVTLARWAEFRAIGVSGFAIGTNSAVPVRIGTNSTTAIEVDANQKVHLSNATAASDDADVPADKGYVDATPFTPHALTDVTTTSQTRTVDSANGIVQTLAASEDFTLDATGPTGKMSDVMFYIYNNGAGAITPTSGTGLFGDLEAATNGETLVTNLRWDGQQAVVLASVAATGDLRPT